MTKAPINGITCDDVSRWKSCFRGERNTLDHYQEIATKSAFYPGQGTALGLAYVALKLNGEAGEFAEHVGKAMRDDDLTRVTCGDNGSYGDTPCVWLDEDVTDQRRALLIKEVGDMLWYLSAACNELGITLSDAAYGNLCKLADRAERDALRGSGDER